MAGNTETSPLLGADDLTRVPSYDPSIGEIPPQPLPLPTESPPDKDLLDDDPDNPLNWPRSFKWFIVAMQALMAFTVTFNCIAVVPVASAIMDSLDASSPSAPVLLVTIWELGEAAGPLLIAPLSEVYGRYPVMNAANVLFIAATALAALSPTATTLIAARCLTGVAVAVNVLNPAIVGDIFPSEERGSPLSLIQLFSLIGGSFGPAISGAVAEHFGWRMVLWLAVAVACVCEALYLFGFRETYRPVILQRKGTGEGVKLNLKESLLRPFAVITGSAVLAGLSLFASVTFTHFYIMTTTLPDILRDIYGLSPAEIGLCFPSFAVGSVASVIICNAFLDRLYTTLKARNDGIGRPEYRLPLVIIGGLTLPIAMTAYGWLAEYHLPLPLLLLSVVFMGCTLMLAFLPVMAFVVDAAGIYSASAMTGVIVSRCLMGTFLPLTAKPLRDAFGYGWAFTILGVGTILLAPIPMSIFRWGPKWRQWSKYTRDST